MEFSQIPLILNLGTFERPIPRGLHQFSEILSFSYRIFEHPFFLWDCGERKIDPFKDAMEDPEEYKKFNRTIIERTISQAQAFADMNVDGTTLTMNGQGIELAISHFRDDWAIMNEVMARTEQELKNEAINFHFLRLHLGGQLIGVLKLLLSTTESLITEVLKGYTIDRVKKQPDSSEAYKFLIRWRADLQNKKDQFTPSVFEAIIQVIDTELGVAEKIENHQSYSELKKLVESFLTEREAARSNSKLLRELVKGDYNTFQNDLCELVLNLFSYHDIGNNEPEKVYHSFLLGIVNSFTDFYEPSSNQEAGHGRFDILLVPHDKDMSGVLIEVKRSNSADDADMKKQAVAALKQVNEKDYAIKFRSKGVTNWVTFAAVFYGKALYVEFEVLQDSKRNNS